MRTCPHPVILAFLVLVAGATSLSAQSSDAPARAPTADQKVILVTGSTDGLGREVAQRLAAAGAHVIVHGRNQARGAEVVSAIEEAGGSARFYAADLASLAQVREFGATLLRDYDRIDVLINNAGIWLTRGERQLSADGHELHFAVNYLAGYALTRTLLPRLLAAAPGARIINVASTAQTPLDFDDIMLSRGYSGSRGYGQSKLAQVLFTMDLAEELAGRGVSVNALHPATLMNTTMVEQAGIQPRSSVEDGVAAVLQLVNAPDIGTGQYFNGLRAARANAQAYDADARAQLRRLSAELTGVR